MTDAPELSPAPATERPPAPETRPRVWPLLVVCAAQAVVVEGFSRWGTTNLHNAAGFGVVPGVAMILALLWWVALSRTPWRDRLAGAVLAAAALGAVVLSQNSPDMGGLLLLAALPWMTYGTAAVLLATWFLRWPLRRWALALLLIACAAGFCAQRVDSISAGLAPVTSWRWNATTAEQAGALALVTEQGRAEVPPVAGPGDWPAFRGPARDAVVAGENFSTDWAAAPPKELWRVPVGAGWSSFTAVGGYLFTQEQRGPHECVTCYDAKTGAVVWQHGVEALFEDGMGLGPRATPAYADGRIHTLGCTGVVLCLDAATGGVVWQRDLRQDAGTGQPSFGMSASPLVSRDLVLFFSGGSEGKHVTAYHRATGDIAWQAGHRAGGYASPHAAVVAGVPQILMVSDYGIQTFTPETGAPLWDHAWGIKTNPRCTQPVVVDGNGVFFGGTGNSGTRRINVSLNDSAWTVEEAWSSKQFRPYFNDGVLHKGLYYGFDGDRLACLDPATGKRRWAGERYNGQLLLVADMDMLLVIAESGDVVLLPATPEEPAEIARFHAITGKTWNYPLLLGGKLYVRNAQEAACFELPQAGK